MSDEVLTGIRAINSVVAFASVTLFSALLTYRWSVLHNGARLVGCGFVLLLAMVSTSSAWRAAHGPEWVPSVMLLVALLPLLGVLAWDFWTRRNAPPFPAYKQRGDAER